MDNIVHMDPSKEFFIDIITRDIKLDRSIFDLIDNSIDAAKCISKNFKGYKIRLTLNKSAFIIEDNCGGITINQARNHAFKFGNINQVNKREATIGHFRIGMKRAFFRIGSIIKVESATKEDFFSFIIDTEKWRRVKEWSIPFKSFGINMDKHSIGTIVSIKKLNKEATESFASNDFIKELRSNISNVYKDVIRKGLTIIVNDLVITTSRRVNETEIFKYLIEKSNYEAEILIKRDRADYDESGWYVYLNDRLVVKADKTELSGWNIGNEEFSYKLRGYVKATSKIEGVLPFNTTKDGLDTGNFVYKELRNYMISALKESFAKIPKGDLATIRYERPRIEVEKLKAYLDANSYKRVGEITYDEYVKENNIL